MEIVDYEDHRAALTVEFGQHCVGQSAGIEVCRSSGRLGLISHPRCLTYRGQQGKPEALRILRAAHRDEGDAMRLIPTTRPSMQQ